MKIQCPQCNQIQQSPAQFCNKCGVQFVVQPKKAPSNTAAIVIVILIAVPILCCAMSSALISNQHPQNPDTTTSVQGTPNQPPLKLLSSRGEIEYDYVTVTGEVQNTSDEKLDDVWVVVNQYGADGQLINSESSVIEYQPLMPGQTSPFKSMMRHNPLMKTYTIGFKHFIGGEIQYTDARPKKEDKKTKKGK